MSSFKGSYKYSVDAKGRVNLPLKLRKYLSAESQNTFVVTLGFEQCLYAYPLDEWKKNEQMLRSLSTYHQEHRRFIRVMLEHAEEIELDGQFRIMIPQEHRDRAQIKEEVHIVGTLDKIEFWNPQLYDEYKKSSDETYEEIAAKVMVPKL